MTDIRRQVLDAAMAMYTRGLVVGTAGNVSARAPDGTICMTPSSLPYPDTTLDDLVFVDLEGEVVAGERRPSTEKQMHLECYRRHPEVQGVMHCHPAYASMFAAARQPVPAVIEEVIIYIGGDVPVAEYATTGTDELAAEVGRHVADRSAVLMANHGLLCVGKSVEDALHSAEVVERTAHIVFGARTLGGEAAIPADVQENFASIYRWMRSETWPRAGTTEEGDEG